MTATGIVQAKQTVRERIWALLERSGVVEPGVHGYIPAFAGFAAVAEIAINTERTHVLVSKLLA